MSNTENAFESIRLSNHYLSVAFAPILEFQWQYMHTHTHICSPSVSHHAESIKAYFGSRVLLHACHQISSNQYWIGVIARKYCLVSWIFSFGTFIGSSSASECGLFVARAKKESNETKKNIQTKTRIPKIIRWTILVHVGMMCSDYTRALSFVYLSTLCMNKR